MNCMRPPKGKDATVCEEHAALEKGKDWYAGRTHLLFTGGVIFLMCPCGCHVASTIFKGNLLFLMIWVICSLIINFILV